jgi:hypothetical protein
MKTPRIICSLIALSVALVSGAATAQEATPVAEEAGTPLALAPFSVDEPFAPSADACTVEPVDASAVASSLGTPVPVTEPEITANGINRIVVTGAADSAAVDQVLDTLTEFWACINAGNRAAMASLMTTGGIVSFFEIDTSVSQADLDAAVESALAPADPRGEDELASIDGVLSVVWLEDGRTAALVLNTDPRIAGGDQVIDMVVFVNLNNALRIDLFLADPFDQMPDYGYEKG